MTEIVGLLHYPWGEDYGVGAARRRTPQRLYRRAVVYKANPRDPSYMQNMFAERHPGGALVRADREDWRLRLGEGVRPVLLYPDASGLGFRRFERGLRDAAPDRPIEVLNGRRREFVLDRRTRRALLVRRFLERSLLFEGLAVALLALLTPVLLAIDLLQGRR